MSARRGVAVVLVGLVGVAGCGGSGKPKPAGSKSISTAGANQFVTQANGICAQAAAKAGTLASTSGQPLARQLAIVEQQNVISRDEAAQLSGLTPPPDKLAAYRTYIAAIDRRNTLDEEIVTALRAGDRARARTLSAQAKTNSNAAQATALGLTACAQLDTG